MKLINLTVTEDSEHAWKPQRLLRFLCKGNNCDVCSFKFKCYTERGDLNVEMVQKSFESPAAFLNKQTRSKIYREGTKKFRKYVPITGTLCWK